MKYFFLSDGWAVARVWGIEGLWNTVAWRRQPEIERLNVCVVQHSEKMWLYKVEDAVVMVEVKPLPTAQVEGTAQTISKVMLKRLIDADQVIDRLGSGWARCELGNTESQGTW